MTIKVTYNVTDVYMTQSVSPVYINVSYSDGGSSGGGTWGTITGTLSNQTDLQNALNAKFDDPTGTTAQYLRGDGSLATFPALTGYVPYTGATTNVDLGEYEIKAGQLTLDVSPTGTAAVGTTRWNDTTGVSETTLKGGNVLLRNGVDLVARVVNKVSPNTTLTKAAYQAVRVSGAQGQRLAVAFAQANNDANSADTIGLVIETIPTNQEGFIMAVGQLENINTTGSLQGETWVDGDVLYLSPTIAGAITKVKPTGNGHIVVIGYVEYAHANNGKIYVKVMNGWELDELHDVSIVSVANNEALIYESSTALWKNKTIATALGYTPVPTTRTITINGVSYDLSADRTWTIAAGISGSGTSGQVTYWSGSSAVTGNSGLTWNNTDKTLNILQSQNVFGSLDGFTVNDSSNIQANFSLKGGTAANSPRISISSLSNALAAPLGGTGLITNYVDGNSFHPLRFLGSRIDFETTASTYTSRVTMMRVTPTTVLIGSTSDNGQRLQVYGDTLLRGSGNSSTTTALTVQNSSSTNLFTVRNDGLSTFTNTVVVATSVSAGILFSGTRFSEPISASTYTQILVQPSSGNKAAVFQFAPSGTSTASAMEFYHSSALNIAERFVFKNTNGLLQIGADGAALPLSLMSNNINQLYMFANGNLMVQNGGTFTDVASSRFTINSTTQGFLPPRMTTTQKNAIATPAAGLVVYDTTLNKLCVYTTAWETITSI